MRESNWQVKDVASIIDLVVQNASIVKMDSRAERDLRGKLKAMRPEELWKHIYKVYDGKLMEEDIIAVDPIEVKRREFTEAHRKPLMRSVVTHTDTTPVRRENKDKVWEADTYFSGKKWVKKCFTQGDVVVVIPTEGVSIPKVKLIAERFFPSVKVEVIK